jgi:predicted DNA-binding transcriptional regulator AlpA
MSVETEVSLELLTKKQLVEKLGISPRTLDGWMASRKIPVIKVGGIIRFNWSRVREALDAFEVKEASRG